MVSYSDGITVTVTVTVHVSHMLCAVQYIESPFPNISHYHVLSFSRDTSGAQAAIAAAGGVLCKLSPFVENQSLDSYCYLKSEVNLDFVPGLSFMTPYNANLDADTKARIKGGEKIRFEEATQPKAYSNLCGLFALAKGNLEAESSLDNYHQAIQRALAKSPPAYD